MSRHFTHEKFIDQLPKDREYIVVGTYKKQSEKILISHKYGDCLITGQSLINGTSPSTQNAVDKTAFFKNKLKDFNNFFKEGYFNLIGEYVKYNIEVLVENKYGICSVKPKVLLMGFNLSIRSAVDPHSYFCEMVSKKNTYYANGDILILSTFINDSVDLLVKTKRGEHVISPYSLFNNNLPNINTSTNKNEYIVNQFLEVHGELYDYSKVLFKSHKKQVIIICEKHGEFLQTPDHHYRGYGCTICAREKTGYKLSQWLRACPNEKGKFYVLKCENDSETFIKIGVTCNSVEIRYRSNVSMPYNYKVLNLIESDDREMLWNLEKYLKRNLKENGYAYTPKIHFEGAKTEVFYFNNKVKEKINEQINNIMRHI